jgi:cytoskeletal protein CcmA (bactofilin family)
MFTKEAVQDTEEFDGNATFVDESLSFAGNTTSKGHLHVEGEIKGDVICVSIEVGPKGRIAGDVSADEVIVAGRVVGSIRGGNVALKPESYVEGDISYESLMIEHGAHFEGSLKRGDRKALDDSESKGGSKGRETSPTNGSSKAEAEADEAGVAAE